jgi:general L-amino acid transport system permease protein
MAQANLDPSIWVNRNHPQPARKAPASEAGVLGWLRANLFSGFGNTLLTLVMLGLVYYAVSGALGWSLAATWQPVWANRKLLAVGGYPSEQLMQPMLALMFFALLFGLSAGRWGSFVRNIASGFGVILLIWIVAPTGAWLQVRMAGALALLVAGYAVGRMAPISNRWLGLAWLLMLPISLMILHGGILLFGFAWYPISQPVSSNLFGGLLLTSLLTMFGISLSLPIGIALALGRRSKLPVIKYFCVAYIEIIRGVPFISILFMAAVILPLFLPAGISSPASVTRAVIATMLFSAAYLAETVRGGLQSIPKGQFEAADALGLTGIQKMRLIVLPQALRAVIPDLVGQFIGLFKDTSLVALVGLADFLSSGRSILVQPAWSNIAGGITREVYLSIALVYFVVSFGMSWASRRIERELGVGKR